MGVNSSGDSYPGGKLFRGNYPEGKSPEGNVLGGNFIGGNFPGVVVQGEKSSRNVRISYFITQYLLKVACLLCLHSQFNSVSKLILYSARIGIIMIISALHFL